MEACIENTHINIPKVILNKSITIEKNGPIMTFKKETGEKATFNFEDQTFFKHKTGNYIKNKQSWFKKYEIDDIKSDDEKIQTLLVYIKSHEIYCRNIGTLVDRIYSNPIMEKWVNSGCKVELESRHISRYKGFKLKEEPNFYPKQFINFLRATQIKMNSKIENEFVADRDKAIKKYNILMKIYDKTLNIKFVQDIIYRFDTRNFRDLVLDYNYDPEALIDYLSQITEAENLTVDRVLFELSDYAMMQSFLSPNGFKKYPTMLLSVHQILVGNHKALKTQIDEFKFTKATDIYRHLAYDKDSEFDVIIPENPKDLIIEGNELQHCVKYYGDKVTDKRVQICFVRRKKRLR